MKAYEWILFDVDDTLFHFDALSALKIVFEQHELTFTEEDYQTYQAINRDLWQNYQNGKIKPHRLREDLFVPWAERLNKTSLEINNLFIQTMCEISDPLHGAVNLIQSLKGKTNLGIITNGFSELLDVRLTRTGLHTHFDVVVISEQVGFAKPSVEIFEHALQKMGNPTRENVLIVGDNPESDIIGGNNAGIETCWLNIHNKTEHESIKSHHQVSSLLELEKRLLGKYQIITPNKDIIES